MITANSIVIGVAPDMTLTAFSQVLDSASSPALVETRQLYKVILNSGVSHSFCLALFMCESGMGSAGFALANRSMGNTRTTMPGNLGQPVTTAKGVLIRYPTWMAGCKDLVDRLTRKDYVYAQEGRVTISRIIERFSPESDGNDTAGYVTRVCKLMNQWIVAVAGGSTMTAKPNITWVGSPNHYNGRGGQKIVAIVDHIIVGSIESADGWFNNPASQVSSTFGVAKDGRIHQYVALEDAAWANGITESVDPACDWLVAAVGKGINPNTLTVSIEHEGNSGDVMPEAQYQATLALHRWLVDLYGIPIDRQHIIGHYQVMRFTKANCPGTGFPWTRLINDLQNGEVSHVTSSNNNTQGVKPTMLMNGHVLAHGMLDYWNAVNVTGVQHPLGLPISEEQDYTGPDGKKLTIQVFERGVLGFDISVTDPAYRVQGLITGPEWMQTHIKAA